MANEHGNGDENSDKKKKTKCNAATVILFWQSSVRKIFRIYGNFMGRFPYIPLLFGLGLGFGCASGIVRIELKEVQHTDFQAPNSKIVDSFSKFNWYNNGRCNKDCGNQITTTTTTTAVPQVSDNDSTLQSIRSKRSIEDPNNIYHCRPRRGCSCSGLSIIYQYIGSDPEGFVNIRNFDKLLEAEQALMKQGPRPGVDLNHLCERIHKDQPSSGCKFFYLEQVNTTQLRQIIRLTKQMPFPWMDDGKLATNILGDVKIETYEGGDSWATSVQTVRNDYKFCMDSAHKSLIDDWVDSVYELTSPGMTQELMEEFDIRIYCNQDKKTVDRTLAILIALIPKFGATLIAVTIWASVAMVGSDAVTSKIWAGFFGIFSTLLSVVGGIGLLTYLGNPFPYTCAAVPFLILAIGLDDMFVLLTAQRHTSVEQARHKRMAYTMYESGTAIFITAITNVVAESVGSRTPFEVISSFTIYTLTLMSFDFILQITIYASSLALLTMAEPKGRHSCCCCFRMKIINQKMLLERSVCYIVCCAANAKSMRKRYWQENSDGALMENQFDDVPNDDGDSDVEKEEKARRKEEKKKAMASADTDDSALKKLANRYANFLIKSNAKYAAIVLYIGYAAFSIYGITKLHFGLRSENLSPYGSPEYEFYKIASLSFYDFHGVAITFDKHIDYFDPDVRTELDEMFGKLHDSGYFKPGMTRYWLYDYMKYLDDKPELHNLAMQSKENFYDILYSNFTNDESKQWLIDDGIKFCPQDKTFICLSRANIVAFDMRTTKRQVAQYNFVNGLVEKYPQLGISFYDYTYFMYEAQTQVLYVCVYYIVITIGIAIVIACFMVPHLVLIFYITVMLLSQVMGLLGTLPYFGLDMDYIVLTMMIVNIGYVVDFVMHMSYDYMVAPAVSRQDKTIHALADVAHAMLPAGIGTIMSVAAMATTNTYIYFVIFMAISQAVVISAIHSCFFLPVFLAFFGPIDGEAMILLLEEKQRAKEEMQRLEQERKIKEKKETAAKFRALREQFKGVAGGTDIERAFNNGVCKRPNNGLNLASNSISNQEFVETAEKTRKVLFPVQQSVARSNIQSELPSNDEVFQQSVNSNRSRNQRNLPSQDTEQTASNSTSTAPVEMNFEEEMARIQAEASELSRIFQEPDSRQAGRRKKHKNKQRKPNKNR